MTGIEFVFPILYLIGLYLFVSNAYWFKGVVTEGVVWGIQINATKRQKSSKRKHTILSAVGLVLSILTVPKAFMSLITLLFSGGFFGKIYILACIIAVPAIAVLSMKKINKLKKNNGRPGDTNAFVLEQLPMIQRVNEQIAEANSFIIAKDGIGLVDVRNFCFAAEYYRDYRLGDLSTAHEMALVGMYFAQKYNGVFTYEPTFNQTFVPGVAIISASNENIYLKSKRGTTVSELESYVFCRNTPVGNPTEQPINK